MTDMSSLRRVSRLALAVCPAAALALVALAPLAGCATVDERQTRLYAPTAVRGLAVDVEHDMGAVEIRIDPRLERAVVTEELRTEFLASDEQREAMQKNVHVQADVIDEGEGFGTLRIRSTSEEPLASGRRVNLRITMPRCDGVRVRAHNGDVILVGVSGALQVEAQRDIEVRTNQPLTAPVALLTQRGDVYLQMPEGSAGRIEAQSAEGQALFRSELVLLDGYYARPNLVRGVLAEGVNPMVARSDTGNVRVIVMDDPESLVRWRAGQRGLESAFSAVPIGGN